MNGRQGSDDDSARPSPEETSCVGGPPDDDASPASVPPATAQTAADANPDEDLSNEISPTLLASWLAAGLIGLVLVLSLLSPREQRVGLERMEELVAAGSVERLEILDDAIIGRLSEAVVVEVEDHQIRTRDVLLPIDEPVRQALARWQAAGLPTGPGDEAASHRWMRDLAWTVIVGALLLFGVYHLVQQARRHRREGSPRERLAQAQKDLEEGRIRPEEFEKRVAEITPEL